MDLTTALLMRTHLVESIVPLAASGDDLVRYSHSHKVDINEGCADFLDWTFDCAPGMVAAGVLPASILPRLQVLCDQTVSALAVMPTAVCQEAAQVPEWIPVRATAATVLEQLSELGESIPDILGLMGRWA